MGGGQVRGPREVYTDDDKCKYVSTELGGKKTEDGGRGFDCITVII